MIEIFSLITVNIATVIVAFFIGRAYQDEVRGSEINWNEDQIGDE